MSTNNTTPTTSTSSNPRASAGPVLPQRRPAVLPQAAPRQPFRVLHTNRTPAQLSLFLRPPLGAR